jgi:hypothetical protein
MLVGSLIKLPNSRLCDLDHGQICAKLPCTHATIIAQIVTSFPTALPTSFPDPMQGHGALSLTNLPALPPVLDKTVADVVGAFTGLRKLTRGTV